MVNENDMPLVANTTDIVVRHYILNLACDFEKKIFSGRTVLFLEPVEFIDKPGGAITKSECSCNQTESRFASKTGRKTYNSLCDTLFTCAESELNLEEFSKGKGQLSASEDVNKENKFGGKANKGKAKNEDHGKDAHAKGEFMCILDCCQLNVKSVKEVEIDTDEFMSQRFSHHNLQFLPKCSLDFSVDDWSLQIWKEGIYCRFCFPKFIEIEYETIPEGKSLLWVDDQDGNPAVFTYGAWINNRALFPCQEPPAAMATWSATVTTCETAVVLMSGDKDPVIYSHNDMLHYFYHSEAALPMATLSLAVGFWKGEKIQNRNSDSNSKTSNISYRIFAPPSLFEKAKKEFSDYLVRAVDVAVSFLGEYPFPRIDLLIVPRGFGSLGMANPNLIFLSQSLLAGDRSMCIRVAHEVAHAWFGLLIGSSDWTEEWLSEGFATFMEDLIHSKTVYMSSAEKTDFLELRSFLRLKTLQAEMENVDPELLKLSPNEGKVITESIDGKEAIVIKNGQNPGKAFIQVHYIKGFFILKHLSNIVGLWHFLDFLKSYVERYRRQLVGSKEVFEMFIEKFPQICEIEKITLDGLISHWLHSSKIPQEISTAQPSDSNSLFKVALSEAKRWKTSNKALLKRKPHARKRKKYSLDSYVDLSAIQLTFLLEELLGESKLSPVLMKKLERTYDMSNANADVRHRWCELVIKHRYFPGYVCLSKFLRDDLAMGIYLYSELIYSGAPSHRTIVEESLRSVISEMEPNYKTTISEMLEDALH